MNHFPVNGSRRGVALISLILFLCSYLPTAFAYESGDQLTYQRPPQALARLVDAPLAPLTIASPDQKRVMLLERPSLPSIAELAQPELRLAGTRINPRNYGPSRPRFSLEGISILTIESGASQKVSGLPEGMILNPSWSPDGRHIACLMMADDGISLYLVDAATAQARALTGKIVNGVRGFGVHRWMPDSGSLLCLTRPENMAQVPEEPAVPAGPNVQETSGRKAPARTYQDLLKNPHDEALFESFFTSQILKIALDGKVTKIGEPGLYDNVDPAPDGSVLLVETYHRPFSYLVPMFRFPQRIEIWDWTGKVIRLIADLPLAENVPKGFSATRTGPRSVSWRGDRPATLAWVEAQDGGDPDAQAEVRDKLFALDAPFEGEPKVLASFALRFNRVMWGSGDIALATESWWNTRNLKVWRLAPDHPERQAQLIEERSFEDSYNDPGQPLMISTDRGTSVLHLLDDGKSILLAGEGASPEGNKPFLDKYNLESGKTQRLWQSKPPFYESLEEVLDLKKGLLLIMRESNSTPPNLFLANTKKNQWTQLTHQQHPTPELADVKQELIKYQRADGVQLTATLYLPPGYKPENGPLPVLMWAYPREFKSADAAGQVTDSPHRFARISFWGALPFLTQGYAVLDDPAMPIIGEGDTQPNDTYIQQLVANAQAAVDEVVRRGVGDPNRLAIGGHSYGAFMVANLLAHSDLFRAGIARSGAYNRTLTPFGFQAEERTFWEAPEVYGQMSPFFNAPKINEPLLMIHGEADNNSGTFTMQSERLFQAIKGLGGTARLVLLPHESHGYRARESMLHMLWEEFHWLETHVKPVRPEPVEAPAAEDSQGLEE